MVRGFASERCGLVQMIYKIPKHVASAPHVSLLTKSQMFYQEAVIWKHMTHPNILPLRGIILAPTQFKFVRDFMPNGTLQEYARENPHVNRLELVSVHGIHCNDLPIPLNSYPKSPKASVIFTLVV